MPNVAVVAHSRKSLGGGLPELRKVLDAEGVTAPMWHEVKKSRRTPEHARRAAAFVDRVPLLRGGEEDPNELQGHANRVRRLLAAIKHLVAHRTRFPANPPS